MILDVPPELFARIVRIVVDDVGVDDAWKLRAVCKTFDSYIKDDILFTRPRSDFQIVESHAPYRPKLRRGAIRANLGDYLLSRTIKLLDAHPYLPSVIKSCAEYVVGFEPCATNEERKARKHDIAAQLCKAAYLQSKEDVWHVLEDGLEKTPVQLPFPGRDPFPRRAPNAATLTPQQQKIANNLAAAACIGNQDAILDCLDEGADLLLQSYTFGYSLTVAAAYSPQPATISFLLRQAFVKRITKKDKDLDRIYLMFNDAYTISLHKQEYAMAAYLLDWFSRHVPTPMKKLYTWWLLDAISVQDARVVEAVLNIKVKGSVKVTWDRFAQALGLGSLTTMKVLIEKGGFVIDRYYWTYSALAEAVNRGHVVLVRELLEQGANPNGPPNPSQALESPLHAAVEKNELELVELLLAHGATLGGHFGATERRTLLKLAESKSHSDQIRQQIYRRLQKAKKQEDAVDRINELRAKVGGSATHRQML